jgi:hypothetical protein
MSPTLTGTALSGSSFLLQYVYTAHLAVIEQLVGDQFSILWKQEFGARDQDVKLVPIIRSGIEAVRHSYEPFDKGNSWDLGVFACPRSVFQRRFQECWLEVRSRKRPFVYQVLQFCRLNIDDLLIEQVQSKQRNKLSSY